VIRVYVVILMFITFKYKVLTLLLRLLAEPAKVLGDNDLLVPWQKPAKNKKSSYSLEDREKLPEKLLLRQIKVTINSSGFRTSSFYIITTLLDADRYPAADIADLYFQRWDVELVFRDIKPQWQSIFYDANRLIWCVKKFLCI
jgi:IS4 transposase